MGAFMGIHNLNEIPNIKEFIKKGEQIVTSSPEDFAIVAVDLSNFKHLNDLYGMDEADNAVLFMGNYLFFDNPNCILACRTVGDQFRALVCLYGRSHDEEIKLISDMNDSIQKYFSIKYPKVYLHVYTGLYFIDKKNFDMRISIDKAHFAKKQIKGNFQSKCNLFIDEEYKIEAQQMEMVKRFETASVTDGIKVFLQPKINCVNNKLIGAEALCRMTDDDGEYISPAMFIPVLEKNGLLGQLDFIMMENTFKLMRKWLDADLLSTSISINLSRTNFYNQNLFNQIVNLRDKYDIPVELIELEVTETTFIDDMSIIYNTIEALRKYGFKISVDDFGAGYSSLGMLSTIPADIIKLDSSFSRKSLSSAKGIAIVKNVINMLKETSFDIICEGIETEGEKELIHSLGCDKIQGFLYDRPLPSEIFANKYIYNSVY